MYVHMIGCPNLTHVLLLDEFDSIALIQMRNTQKRLKIGDLTSTKAVFTRELWIGSVWNRSTYAWIGFPFTRCLRTVPFNVFTNEKSQNDSVSIHSSGTRKILEKVSPQYTCSSKSYPKLSSRATFSVIVSRIARCLVCKLA